jgi:hypothetical protein
MAERARAHRLSAHQGQPRTGKKGVRALMDDPLNIQLHDALLSEELHLFVTLLVESNKHQRALTPAEVDAALGVPTQR